MKIEMIAVMALVFSTNLCFGESKSAKAGDAGLQLLADAKEKLGKDAAELKRQREKKKAEIPAIIDHATSADIVRMLDQIPPGSSRKNALVALCKAEQGKSSCGVLTAGDAAHIIAPMPARVKHGRGDHITYDPLVDALNETALPWENWSAADISRNFLPKILATSDRGGESIAGQSEDTEGRRISVEKWIEAHQAMRIDRSISGDIVSMIKQLPYYQRGGPLVQLCKSACNGLTAQAIGQILDGISGGGDSDQGAAISHANLPWEEISASELTQDILPRLLEGNRGLAILKWTQAHRKKG